MRKLLSKPALIACLLAGFLAGCSLSETKDVQSLFGYSMGTSYSIKVVAGLNEARNMQLGIEGVLADINSRMSTYLPHSDLSEFAAIELNKSLTVDAKTALVVDKALEIAVLTDGYFDPTVAPLVDLWGFGPTPRNHEVPSQDQIKQNLTKVGYTEVLVDLNDQTLIKTAPRELDLSAIAKGYAVDEVARYLDSKGFENYLVEVGGEMRFSGTKPNGVAWRIAIEKPLVNERSPFRILEVGNAAIATSGDYRNYFEVDGQRFSHSINPKTGYPIEHDLASVTVVMDSCIEADAFATAFSVMGRAAALKLAEALDIAVFMIYKQDEDFLSVQSSSFTEQFGNI